MSLTIPPPSDSPSAAAVLATRLAGHAPAVAAVVNAMAAFTNTATDELIEQLAAQTSDLRRGELAELIEVINDTRATLAEVLNNLTGVQDWTPYGETTLDEAHGLMATAGQALYALKSDLTTK
jgi:hypothetical protein